MRPPTWCTDDDCQRQRRSRTAHGRAQLLRDETRGSETGSSSSSPGRSRIWRETGSLGREFFQLADLPIIRKH